MIFRRKIYDKLLAWKRDYNGRSAVLVEGARRVGKSTVVEEFVKNEYESYIIVNFSECSPEIRDLFEDVSNLDYIFVRLQLEYHVDLHVRKSAIVFDEVQFVPKARQAIKKLVKDGRYDYLETGLLISIRKNVEHILIPSEEIKFKMYPMDYEEFCWATGDTVTMPILADCFKKRTSLGDDMNRKLMRNFRLYMLVGGMPQAVATYIETNNLRLVDLDKRAILTLYEDDFNKIDVTGVASRMLHHLPAQLTGNVNRYEAVEMDEVSAMKMEEIISEMRESMVVNLAYHTNDPNTGLSFYVNPNRYKLFMGDTGLFVTLAYWDREFTDNTIYQKLLTDKLSADVGYLYENMVAQMLRAAGRELYYYTFPTPDGSHHYEVDFLIADGAKISPIEVKSSNSKTHASLDAFCEKYSSRIQNKYLIHTKDLRKESDLLCLPIYMTAFL